MLDRDLTIERGLSEIGEVVQESHVTITPDSPVVQMLKETRLRHDELYQAGKVYTDLGPLGSGPRFMRRTSTDEEWREANAIDIELSQLGGETLKAFIRTRRLAMPKQENLDIATQPFFSNPFDEAIQNAIEHGTNFCQKGNIKVHGTTGTEGILAVISQPTPGLTREKVEKALTCEDAGELRYHPTPHEIRGMGLACFRNPENAQVWFEFSTEESPEFKVIILQTRKRLMETGLY